MRVIAGSLRGRKLRSPEGRGTRPMLDRVREALFSTLGDQVDEARVLDLFAGTGSLGIEALSRGAASARFVERDRRVQAVLSANLAGLGIEEDSELRGGDALTEAKAGEDEWDIAFLDPPYPWLRRGASERQPLLEAVRHLYEHGLRPGGVLVLHVPPRELDEEELPGEPERRVYGRSALWYIWKPGEAPGD